MSKQRRLDRLESKLCPVNRYHWQQCWQGYGVLTDAAITCLARGYDTYALGITDELFRSITGIDHTWPPDVIRVQLREFLAGLDIWTAEEIEETPSGCLANFLMSFIDVAGRQKTGLTETEE